MPEIAELERCMGCGERWGLGGCRHRLPCPYFDAWHAARTQADACGATKELGPEGKCKDYADAHWREHWTPGVGDWVVGQNSDFGAVSSPCTFCIGDIREFESRIWYFEGKTDSRWSKKYLRPAWPDEIAAAQAAAGAVGTPTEKTSKSPHSAQITGAAAKNLPPAQPEVDRSQEHDEEGTVRAQKRCGSEYYDAMACCAEKAAASLRIEEQAAARARWWRFINLLDQGR